MCKVVHVTNYTLYIIVGLFFVKHEVSSIRIICGYYLNLFRISFVVPIMVNIKKIDLQ